MGIILASARWCQGGRPEKCGAFKKGCKTKGWQIGYYPDYSESFIWPTAG
jgi:hypothetical protein